MLSILSAYMQWGFLTGWSLATESAKIGAARLGCQAIVLKKQECHGLLSLQTVLAIVSGVSVLHHAVLTN